MGGIPIGKHPEGVSSPPERSEVERSWPPDIGLQLWKHRNEKQNSSVFHFLHCFCAPQDFSMRLFALVEMTQFFSKNCVLTVIR